MMRSVLTLLVSSVIFVPVPSACQACLWDYDTLAMEMQRFPAALELITGKFLRHSPEFYQWRVQDRLARLAKDPTNVRLYDDLAVAYDKLGQHDEAIETIRKKEELSPGLYETYANLGTFYIHSGRLQEGLEEIKRAIQLNPNAHFGREKYQQYLVEYLLDKQQAGGLRLPLEATGPRGVMPAGFAAFVLRREKVGDGEASREPQIKSALRGVMGMMRFGNFDSPVLLEALGDLLLARGYPEDAKRLAARAYLKAAQHTDDENAKSAYRQMAQKSLSMQTIHRATMKELSLEELEKTFAAELAEAERWYAEVRRDEMKWIAAGKNVDEEFSRKYYEDPQMKLPSVVSMLKNRPWLVFVVAAISIAAVGLLWLRGRKRSAI